MSTETSWSGHLTVEGLKGSDGNEVLEGAAEHSQDFVSGARSRRGQCSLFTSYSIVPFASSSRSSRAIVH